MNFYPHHTITAVIYILGSALLMNQVDSLQILPSSASLAAATAATSKHSLFIRRAFTTALVVTTTMLGPNCAAAASAETLGEWKLMNGDVKLPESITLDVKTRTMNSSNGKGSVQATSSSPIMKSLTLRDPTLIGYGGGGAVFSFADDSPTLLKVSWEGSAKTVERECLTLQRLEESNVQGAERCLGQYPYQGSKNEKRVMIVVEPYMRDAVASISEIGDKAKQAYAVEQVSRTLVQMLAANVITIDVQPLISKVTGDVIFIDMTEAQTLRPPFSFLDTTLMSSFATEMATLIPESFTTLATKTVVAEIQKMESQGSSLSSEALKVLSSQFDLP